MKERVLFALHIMIHPFDGFWDMKYEGKGKMKVSISILVLVVLSFIFEKQFTGFLFNDNYGNLIDVFLEFRRVVLPFAVFCIANWSVTTLMDGKGKIRDIIMASGYALTPLIIVRIPLSILTNVLVYDEIAYFDFLGIISYLWFVFLLFIGIMIIHQYTASKAFFTMILTVFSMAVILFISMLFFSLLTEIYGFIYSLYREILYRF